jgi:hypothetical protein
MEYQFEVVKEVDLLMAVLELALGVVA